MLSVIIPSRNDGELVRKLAGQIPSCEIIVVESGELLPAPGARMIASKPGRALQMRRGAQEARGDVLLFVHADSSLRGIDWEAIRDAKSWGCLTVRFASEKPYFRFIEFTSALRARVLGIPFGDQGLVVPKAQLEEAGGIADDWFEDVALSRRLKKLSWPKIYPGVIETSPRRFERNGVVRTHLVMGLVFANLLLGRHAAAKRWYAKIAKI